MHKPVLRFEIGYEQKNKMAPDSILETVLQCAPLLQSLCYNFHATTPFNALPRDGLLA
jgi:hypothetical protein